LRRSNFVALLALAVLTVLAGFSQADALQSLKTSKLVVITVVVTPSPAPVGMLRPAAPAAVPARPAVAFARLVDDPFAGPRQIAASGTAWDVAPGAGPMIAQVAPVQPPPVPVQFNAKADPNSIYLHVIQHTPELDVPYGTTVFPCAFEVYTFYDKATYALNDYGQGTSKSGTGTYPIENFPANSYLSWATPDFSPTFHAYWNSGAPGEKVWTGAMNQAQQHCVDLSIVVPNSLAPDTYTAVIQYNLLVN
jgi:hypothetical protein